MAAFLRILIISCYMMIALPGFAADTSILRLEPVTYERIWGETKILCYSPNGRFVLSMIEKGALHVWEANTGNLLRLFSNPGNKIDNNNNIVTACFSPDSSQIIIADNNNLNISFYNIMTGTKTRQFTINSPVESVSCSPDGKYILLRSKNDIEIRSYDTCITMWRYSPTGNQNRLLTAIFVPQHPEVCIVTNEYKQQTWRYADEAIAAKYGKAGYIVGISPNNHQIIIVKKDRPNNFQLLEQDGDNFKQIEEGICNLKSQYQTSFNIELTVWKRIFIDITTGKENAIISRFDTIVKSVLFLPDGNHVLAVEEEYNNNIYLYFAKCILLENTSNLVLKSIDTPRNSFRDIAASSDGKLFMVVDNKNSSIYDLETGKVLQNFGNKDTKSAMFSPDNNTILIAENGELGQQLISIINITTNNEIVTFDSKIANTWSFAASDKMQYLMIGRDDHTASLWDLTTGQRIQRIENHSFGIYIRQVSISSDGSMALLSDNNLYLWDLKENKQNKNFKQYLSGKATLSPDGKYILFLDGSRSRYDIWSTQTNTKLYSYQAKESGNFSLAFSPDSKYTLTNDYRNELLLCEIETSKYIRSFKDPQNKLQLSNSLFSADGSLLASFGVQSNKIIIWNTVDSSVKLNSTFQKNIISAATFTPEGSEIILGCQDGTLLTVDITTGKITNEIIGRPSTVIGIAYSPDKKLIIAATSDGITCLYRRITGELVCSFFDDIDGNWAVYDTENHFDASNPDVIDSIHGVINNETINIKQLRSRLYTPGLLGILLKDNLKTPDKTTVNTIKLSPELIVSKPQDGETELTIKVINRGGGIGPVNLLLNRCLLPFHNTRISTNTDSEQIIKYNLAEYPSYLPMKNNIIQISAANKDDSMITHGEIINWQPVVIDKNAVSNREKSPTLVPQDGHAREISAIEFSNDGRKVITTAEDGKVILWDLYTSDKLSSFSRNTSRVNSNAIFTPDDSMIVTVSEEDVIFWSVFSGTIIQRYHLPPKDVFDGGKGNIIISPDNRVLLLEISGGGVKHIISWDIITGQMCQNINFQGRYEINFNKFELYTSFGADDIQTYPLLSREKNTRSSTERRLFNYKTSATNDSKKIMATLEVDFRVNLLDISSWKVLATLQEPITENRRFLSSSLNENEKKHRLLIAISSSGDRCAAPSIDNNAISIALWDITKKEKIQSYPVDNIVNYYSFPPFCDFSSDGLRLVIWSSKTLQVQVVDAITGNLLWKGICAETPKDDKITDLRFTPDNKSLLIAHSNGMLVKWDAETGIRQCNYGYKMAAVETLSFINNDHLIMSLSSNLTHQWQLFNGRPRVMIGNNAQQFYLKPVLNPESGTVVETTGNTMTVRDLLTGVSLFKLYGSFNTGFSPKFSKNGEMLSITKSGINEKNTSYHIKSLYNSVDGTLIKEWKITGGNQGKFLSISPDFHYSAMVSFATSTDKLLLFDNLNDSPLPTPSINVGNSKSIFNSDGLLFLILNQQETDGVYELSLCDVKKGLLKWRIFISTKGIYINSASNFIRFTPDEKTILLDGRRGSIMAFDVKSGEMIWKSTEYSIIFETSRNSQLIAATDNQSSNVVDILFTQTGALLAELPGHAAVTCATFNSDDSVLAVGYADGSVVLWDVKTWRKICHLLTFDDGNWAVIDPLGRYDASNAGDIDGLRWVIGDEVVALRQLKERYYEPGLLAKLLGYNDEPLRPVENLATVKLFPTMQITQPQAENALMTINLINREGGIGTVRILVNGKEFMADARGAKPNPRDATVSINVNLLESAALQRGKENLIEVIAANADGTLSSRSKAFTYIAPGSATTRAPELYAVIAGISKYSSDKLTLRFAAKDADAMANALIMGSKRLFGVEKVHINKLTTNSITNQLPTKGNIQQAFKNIANQAQTGDILVVYLAGHGATLPRGNDTYCYLTKDASDLDDITDPVKREKVALTSEELRQWCTRIPALKQVMILDTCAAGAAAGTLVEKREISGDQIRAIERLKDRTGFHILMGCAGNARSYETTRYGQGLLTYSLLQGMKGAALREGQFIDINTLFSYAADQVPTLATGIGGLQRPVIAAPKGVSFDIGQLTADDRANIPGAIAKPLLLRPVLLDVSTIGDPLGLTELLRKRLRDNDNIDWVCIDADNTPDAISIQGAYTMTGDNITMNIKLWQADKEQQHLTITGKKSQVDTVMDEIITQLKLSPIMKHVK